MADGIYAAASGMVAQQTRIDAIANDLANADTPGYRSERVAFEDLVYGSEDGVAVGSGAAAVDAGRSSTAGGMESSDNPLAVAITGPGFFQIRRPDGSIGLTRDGDFQLDSSGSIVTSSGDRLVPPITVPKGVQPSGVSIAQDGTVTAGGRALGKIQVVNVPAPGALLADGDSTYSVSAGSGTTTPVANPQLQQSMLEGSDVDVASAMTQLLDAQQSYSLASRAIQTQDQLLQIANQIKR